MVMTTSSFAVLVEHERDADQERPNRERRKLAELRALHSAFSVLGDVGVQGSRQQFRQADEDEGSRPQKDDDRDLSVTERVSERQDDDHAEDSAQRGHEVVGERLQTKTCRGRRGKVGKGKTLFIAAFLIVFFSQAAVHPDKQAVTDKSEEKPTRRGGTWRAVSGWRKRGRTLVCTRAWVSQPQITVNMAHWEAGTAVVVARAQMHTN